MALDLDNLAAVLDPGARYERRQRRWADGPHEAWAAFDRALGREVALNVAYAHFDVRRFLATARAVARLCHPHILPVLDLGLADGLPYFTTPLLRGWSLREAFDREPIVDGMTTLRHSVAALAAAGRAIDHARRHGVVFVHICPHIIHIGEEPGIVFLEDEWTDCVFDPGDEPDVGDDSFGRCLGNPAYISPEQARGFPRVPAPPSDVYGMGGVLYFLLYGSPPNYRPGSGTLEMLNALLDGTLDVRSRAVLRPEFRPLGWSGRRALRALERLCFRALDFDPARRPPHAGALSLELDAWSLGR